MRAFRLPRILFFVFTLSAAASAQTKPPVAPMPPVPFDPLELATGPVQDADTPEKRAVALGLLELARENQNLHRGPSFSLKVSFESLGASVYAGPGRLEETWISGLSWRWTTQLADYSRLRIAVNGIAYDDKPSEIVMPLRAQMVRSAVFWPVPLNMPQVALRTTDTVWMGKLVTCVLVSGSGPKATWDSGADVKSSPGRRWEETEYCIDPQSGRLQTYSVAPGLYSTYDYENGLPFHGRTLPRTISIVEGGATILHARVESIADPLPADRGLLQPTREMLANGPGATISGAYRFRQRVPFPPGYTGKAVPPVIVNAILGQDGRVLDAEALQMSDLALADAALAFVRHATYPPVPPGRRLQREAFISVQFVPRP
jgi:hypothetical protein